MTCPSSPFHRWHTHTKRRLQSNYFHHHRLGRPDFTAEQLATQPGRLNSAAASIRFVASKTRCRTTQPGKVIFIFKTYLTHSFLHIHTLTSTKTCVQMVRSRLPTGKQKARNVVCHILLMALWLTLSSEDTRWHLVFVLSLNKGSSGCRLHPAAVAPHLHCGLIRGTALQRCIQHVLLLLLHSPHSPRCSAS